MDAAVWILSRVVHVLGFFFCLRMGAAGKCSASSCGAAGSAGAAQQNAACLNKGYAPTTVARGNRIHAGNDHASFASGGDDGADCVTHGK